MCICIRYSKQTTTYNSSNHITVSFLRKCNTHGYTQIICNSRSIGFSNKTVCCKYEFVNRNTGVHTQKIEYFNSELKLEIRNKKRIKIEQRQRVLIEICF